MSDTNKVILFYSTSFFSFLFWNQDLCTVLFKNFLLLTQLCLQICSFLLVVSGQAMHFSLGVERHVQRPSFRCQIIMFFQVFFKSYNIITSFLPPYSSLQSFPHTPLLFLKFMACFPFIVITYIHIYNPKYTNTIYSVSIMITVCIEPQDLFVFEAFQGHLQSSLSNIAQLSYKKNLKQTS